jgi:FkbM family methyltransferase
MRYIIYNVIRKLIKFFTKETIIGKEYNGYKKILYYERSQHLTFLFMPKINYEENIQKRLKHHIRQGDLVFDIGGNIGQYTLPFSELVGKTGKVVSFEPDYKNFAFLQFNVNINRCANVICCNYGIGDIDTELDFFRDTKTGGRMGSFKKEYVRNRFEGFTEKLVVKKLDNIIEKYGEPTFVKIDVEGFELDVIRGLTLTLQNCVFLIEVRGETKDNIFLYFKEKGFQCIWVDGNDKQINKAEEIPGFANLIFRKVND